MPELKVKCKVFLVFLSVSNLHKISSQVILIRIRSNLQCLKILQFKVLLITTTPI